MSAPRVVGELDPSFAWDGVRLYEGEDLAPDRDPPSSLAGAAASVSASPERERWRIVRDPLGLNKLFWAAGANDQIFVAARPWLLVEHGHALDEIAAVPRGLVLDVDSTESGTSSLSLVPDAWSTPPPEDIDIEVAGREIRDRLDRYLAAVAHRHPGASVFVCLSGGLDSSGIAALVADHFPGAVAVSFDLTRPAGARSEDRRVAARLAGDLGLPLLEVTVTPDELLEPLDIVLREGVDWRDFNVHAALVNAALARGIADATESAGPSSLVLTGDLANEFLADYQPERYGDKTYYPLPRLEPVALRSLLVRGLDTCHREVGVFGAWALALIQPYAVAVDTYMRLPGTFLRIRDRKERLCRAIFGNAIPDYVFMRDKTRAQVGGSGAEGGVLAICIDRGIDASALRQRFAQLHCVAGESSLDRFIRAGLYRARIPSIRGSSVERA
ncbi:MAG: asparagine synthase-related protein [Solirubrobacterales bacterium]